MKHGNMRKKMINLKISVSPTTNPKLLQMFTTARFNSRPKLELQNFRVINHTKQAEIA